MANPTESQMSLIIATARPSKLIYTNLMKEQLTFPENLLEKWKRDLPNENAEITNKMMSKSFKMIHQCTTATRLRNFQFRLLDKITGINDKLYSWGIKDSYLCDLCQQERQTFIHLFCTCEKAQRLWSEIKLWTRQTTGYVLETTPSRIIFGTQKNAVLDLIMNITKMFIYSNKMSQSTPRVEGLIRKIEEARSLEKYIATKNNEMAKFEKKWSNQHNIHI